VTAMREETARNVTTEVFLAACDFMIEADTTGELGRITAPTLVIAGRHDWICPPEFSEEIARLVPRAELRIFENSSHSVRADEPQALLDAIAGFVVYKR